MGMSASQVRLLTITKRIHSVENEAERIQNQKMLLGLQSDEAYEEYLAAMEKKDVEYAWFNGNTGNFEWDDLNLTQLFKTIGTDYRLKAKNLKGIEPITINVTGSQQATTTVNLTIENENTGTGFKHTIKNNGQVVATINDQNAVLPDPSQILGQSFTIGGGGTTATCSSFPATEYTYEVPGESTPQTVKIPNSLPGTTAQITVGNKTFSASGATLSSGSNLMTTPSTEEFVICNNLEETCAVLGITSSKAKTDKTIFRELIYNAYAIIESKIYDEDLQQKIWKETSVATNVGLREKTDDKELAKAEAEYEAALRRIDKKEEQYDKDLAKFDQERKALTTQLDTLKTCIKENIDRTFKIFQG